MTHPSRQAQPHSSHPALLLALIFLLLAAGCRARTTPAAPTPTATTAGGLPAVLPPTTTLRPGETRTPQVVTVTVSGAAATATAGAGKTPKAGAAATPAKVAKAPSSTPTPCQTPAGWVVYTILPGDTLSWLALNTGSSVDALMAGNCKTDDKLVAYEEIHLPKRPPAPPPAPIPAENGQASVNEGNGGTSGESCTSIFSCTHREVNAFTFPLVGPGGSYIPCANPPGAGVASWIDFQPLGMQERPEILAEIGTPLIFYACNFPFPDELTIQVTGQSREMDVKMYDVGSLPANSLPPEMDPRVQKVISVYPTCSLPPGDYTLTVNGAARPEVPPIALLKTSAERIMVRPQWVKKGDPFTIFACNYPSLAKKDLKISFSQFSHTDSVEKKSYYDRLLTFTLPVNADGWGKLDQPANPDAWVGKFYLEGASPGMDGSVDFWVIP